MKYERKAVHVGMFITCDCPMPTKLHMSADDADVRHSADPPSYGAPLTQTSHLSQPNGHGPRPIQRPAPRPRSPSEELTMSNRIHSGYSPPLGIKMAKSEPWGAREGESSPFRK